MAAPSYTEDLSDVTLAEATTDWSAYGGGASGLDQNADIAMQGNFCVAKQISNADKGQYYTAAAAVTLGTGDHIWVWHFCGTPGLTDSIQNKGASVLLGTASNAYCQYHVEGNDTYGAAGRVARCYPIDYTARNTNTSPPYRTATGSPGANPQVFGGGLVTTATVKGFNVGIDAIRYGTGAYLTAGELIAAGDASDNPCTFGGFNTTNDNISNRWGILTAVGGGYELQGTFAIGQNNAGTATLCRFKDSGVSIAIANTIHAASTFNKIIIDHASTRCELDNINLTALGTTAPGQFTVTTNNPTVLINGGTWTGLGLITFQSNSSIDTTIFRGTDQIILNGAVFTNVTISDSLVVADDSAVVWDVATDPDGYLDGGSYSAGTNASHAIEFGTNSPTTITLNNITFTGFNASDGQNDSAIYIARTTGTVNVYVNSGTSPTYKSAGATVNIIANPVTVKVTTQTGAGTAVGNSRIFLAAANGTGPFPYRETVTITNSGTTATVSHTGHGMATGDKVVLYGASHQENNGVHTITVTGTNSYTYTMSTAPGSNPTGTITSTFVALEGVTNITTGVLSTSRVYPSDQPVSGWARKSSSSPFYKTGPIAGTITSTTGLTATAVMILDE